MSDDMELDDDEMAYLTEGSEDITPEDVFKLVMLNKVKNTRTTIELKDEEGDTVDLTEIITNIIQFMKEKMEDPNGSQIADQIMPLATQAVVSFLGRMFGINKTAFYLSDPGIREAILYSMGMSFLLLKYVQKHKLIIHTNETELTEEEIESAERKSRANHATMLGSMLGEDPKDVLAKLLEEGKITKEDLEDLANGDPFGEKKKNDKE